MTAELTSLVQTYRFYQTAVYRREKLRVAKDLTDFNDKLLDTFHRRLEANQALPADVALAEVETQATRQQYEAAKQDYALALTDLRTSIGLPETAGSLEPRDPFSIPPAVPAVSEEQLIQCAWRAGPRSARRGRPSRAPRRRCDWPMPTAPLRRSSVPSTKATRFWYSTLV